MVYDMVDTSAIFVICIIVYEIIYQNYIYYIHYTHILHTLHDAKVIYKYSIKLLFNLVFVTRVVMMPRDNSAKTFVI